MTTSCCTSGGQAWCLRMGFLGEQIIPNVESITTKYENFNARYAMGLYAANCMHYLLNSGIVMACWNSTRNSQKYSAV